MDKNNFNNQPDNIRIKFTKIKQIRNKIKGKFKIVTEIKDSIKKSYIHYISRDQEDFFGLDSFHFQNKVLELEVQNMVRLYQYIDNRLYGDYYKLFGEIHSFMKKNLTPKQFSSIKELEHFEKYPIYRDLEPFKTYDFDTINTIHQDIIIIISNVRYIHKDNERSIKEDMKKMFIGLNIDNYIINSQYKNTVLMTTNMKFENYLQVFHKYHFELLEKFYEKLSLCHQHIAHNSNDERFTRSPSVSSTDEDEHSSDDSLNEHTPKSNIRSPKGNIPFNMKNNSSNILIPLLTNMESSLDEEIDFEKNNENDQTEDFVIVTNPLSERNNIDDLEDQEEPDVININDDNKEKGYDEFNDNDNNECDNDMNVQMDISLCFIKEEQTNQEQNKNDDQNDDQTECDANNSLSCDEDEYENEAEAENINDTSINKKKKKRKKKTKK